MLELLRKRRSIRKFTTEKIAPEIIVTLVEAALRAPSSRGINPWKFILVDNPEILAKLSTSKLHGSEFIKGCPLAIVVCADSTISDAWIEDCSIAAIIIQLTAVSQGLGSCWAQIRNRQHNSEITSESYIQKLLNLPEHIKVECLLAVGHPAEEKKSIPAEKLQHDSIKYNQWI